MENMVTTPSGPLWFFAAYYGPDGRKGGKGRPGGREGDLAIEVWHTSEWARDAEADLARARDDIGRVDTWHGYSITRRRVGGI